MPGPGGESTYSQAAGFPALGFNPAPGEPAAAGQLAAQLRELAEQLAQAQRTLTQLAQPGSAWEGRNAQAFAGTVGELPGLLRTAGQSLDQAGRALEGWAGELPRMQSQAQVYEREAQAGQQRLQAAQADPALTLSGQGAMGHGDALSPQEQQAKKQAHQRLDAAQADLAQARASAEQLQQLHAQTAQQTERAVRTATEHAPTQTILDQISGAAEGAWDTVSGALHGAWDAVQKNAEEIAWAGDVLGTISGALGIASLALLATGVGAPAAAALGITALATGAGALGAHSTARAAGADVSWRKIGFDAGGVVLGGTARLASRGVKAAQATKRTFMANKDWQAARQIRQGPIRQRRAVRDYSLMGGDAYSVGGTAYKGEVNQYRSVWDTHQWMGGRYESSQQSRPPRREVADTFCKVAQTGTGP